MKLLLDTCTFLWLIWDEPVLVEGARELIRDPDNTLYLSPISIWEALIKHQRGRLQVNAREPAWQHFTEQRERHDIRALALDEAALRHLVKLPEIHRDPFDRILICQAIEHGLALITADIQIRQYPIRTVWD